MNEGKKDAIIGRAVREERELRENLGVLDKEISDLCSALRGLIKDVTDRTLQFQPITEPLPVADGLSRYGDFSRVVDLVQRRIDCHKRLEETQDALVRMGVRQAPFKVGDRNPPREYM